MNLRQISSINILVASLKIVLLVGALFVCLAIYGFMQYNNRGADIIQDSVHITPLGRTIIHQDGSAGQVNPPVNLNQHLNIAGDFTITAIASDIDKQASIRLYSQPPIIYDQWRYEPPSIEITIDAVKNTITARIWDGSSSTSMDMRTYEVFLSSKIIISLEHVKDQITIFGNNHLLGSMPDHAIFNNDSIWFGLDAPVGSTGWNLASLTAKAMGTGQIKIISPPPLIIEKNNADSLQNLANANTHKLSIGTAINITQLLTDEHYQRLALSQFNILTPENAMKPQFIHPQPNIYDFTEADQLVNVALKNNITVHGHALVYDKSSPDWMTKSNITDRQNIMISHIKNVVSHFKDSVAEWDVVNEPFSQKHALYGFGKTGLEPNIWFEAMGEQYIDLAFKTAHQANPLAKLYLNDYGVEKDGQHWDALLALVKRLQKRGVPIDGVGFESHIYTDGDYLDAGQLTRHLATLKKLGLLVRISEIDVTGDDAQEQINQYVTALDVCLRAPNCTSYTTWGITDKYGSTTRSDRYPLVYGTSLLWDKNFKPKPAYGALQKRLQQY